MFYKNNNNELKKEDEYEFREEEIVCTIWTTKKVGPIEATIRVYYRAKLRNHETPMISKTKKGT
jgi:hypothetical protein